MTYTKEQRKEIHDQLVGAKRYLWNGTGKKTSTRFICHAICATTAADIGSFTIAGEMIENRISPCNSVFGWLVHNAGLTEKELTDEAVQTYRHEWLDHLIKEFSE